MTKDTNFTNEFHLYSQLPVNSNLLGKSKEVEVIGSSKQITSNKETSILKWHGCFAMTSIFGLQNTVGLFVFVYGCVPIFFVTSWGL